MGSSEQGERRTRIDSEVDDLVRVLRGYGVLTRRDLCERVGGDHWSDHQFEAALKQGIQDGRIRKMDGELYELGEREQAR